MSRFRLKTRRWLAMLAFAVPAALSRSPAPADIDKSPLPKPLQPSSFALAGETRNFYAFVTDDGDGRDGVIVFIGGSGCYSNARIRPWFFWSLRGSFRVLALDKAGVAPGAVSGDPCSPDFYKKHDLNSATRDQIAFVRHVWATYPDAARHILFGESEGSWLAPAVAAAVPKTTHVILFSSQGGNGADRLEANGYPYGGILAGKIYLAAVKAYAAIRSEDGGYANQISIRQIRQYFDYAPLAAFRTTRLQVLYAHGGRDDVLPNSLSRKACEELAATANDVAYYYDPQADHYFRTPTGSRLPDFFAAARSWLMGQAGDLSKACPF